MNFKTLFFLLLTFGAINYSVNAQTVNGVPIEEIDATYLEIVGTTRMFSNKVTVVVDFGQHISFFASAKEISILDEENKPVVFNTMVDALNFFAKFGYKLSQAYVITVSNQNVYHYLMEKTE